MRDVAIFGSGGHAKVVIDTMRQMDQLRPCVCFGDGDLCLSVPVLPDEQAEMVIRRGTRHAFIAVGNAALRERLAAQAATLGFEIVTVVSPHAVVAASVRLGVGTAVMAGAVIQPEAAIGDLAIINTRASVDHECRVGRLAHIAPGATLCGRVQIGDRSWIGAGAVVLERLHISADVMVAAGAVVTRDIGTAGGRYAGVPAGPMRSSARS